MFSRSLKTILVSLLALPVLTLGTPAQADPPPGSNWAYQQILNHQIYIKPDGKPTYFKWGRHYLNGYGDWEIRLTKDGTWNAIQSMIFLSSISTGTAVVGKVATVSEAVLASVNSKSIQLAAVITLGASGSWLSDIAKDALLKNRCLGITIPPDGMDTTLNRATMLAAGRIDVFSQPTHKLIRAWFESC